MKVLVRKGYTVPDRYVELGEGEELCPACHGWGEVRSYFGPSWDPSGYRRCWECGGAGKLLRCGECGQLSCRDGFPHHREAGRSRGLCSFCVLEEAVALDHGEVETQYHAEPCECCDGEVLVLSDEEDNDSLDLDYDCGGV